MKIKGLISEDLVNYKKASMTIISPACTWKCGQDYCQNSSLATAPIIEIDSSELVRRYINNPITEAVVMQGLEPFDSWDDVKDFVETLRDYSLDDVVIYSGYNKNEISDYVNWLVKYPNIIIKFGRYLPNQDKHYDDILGVYLASDNQYAERIS